MSTPKRIKNSIKKETLKASDFNQYKIPYSCEDCVHFSSGTSSDLTTTTTLAGLPAVQSGVQSTSDSLRKSISSNTQAKMNTLPNNTARCSLGNNTVAHRKTKQIESYLLSGRMAFCRLLEID